MRKALALGLFVVLSNMACHRALISQSAPRHRAEAANLVRARIGLRQIGDHWACYRSNHGLDEWAAVQPASSCDKAVQYDGEGQLVWEEDTYLSGRKAFTDDQTFEEGLVIHYDHKTSNAELHYLGSDPAIQAIVNGASGGNAAAVLSAADGILKRWGIPRL